MNLFEKGNYQLVSPDFRIKGIMSLEELRKFQEAFNTYDTDTTINQIRDSMVSNYLGYDLLNLEKHGFDAKTSKFSEVKQCSIIRKD